MGRRRFRERVVARLRFLDSGKGTDFSARDSRSQLRGGSRRLSDLFVPQTRLRAYNILRANMSCEKFPYMLRTIAHVLME